MTTDISTRTKPTIKPTESVGSYKTGTLWNHSKKDIIDALGFAPNVDDDESKVQNSWAFEVDGRPCAIWDYKGSHLLRRAYWSVYDPDDVLGIVFGDENIEGLGGWK